MAGLTTRCESANSALKMPSKDACPELRGNGRCGRSVWDDGPVGGQRIVGKNPVAKGQIDWVSIRLLL